MNKKSPEEIAIAILRKNLVKATEMLVSLLGSKDESIRLQAAIAIIEYVLGKPVQTIRYEKSESNSSNS